MLINNVLGMLLACGLAFIGPITARADSPIGNGVKELPIFDAHMHYKQPAWQPYSPSTVIELMDRSGVAMALVSSTPDEGTIRLYEFAPERIVPELRPYHGTVGSSNWTKADGMLGYLKQRMDQYLHQGIGEFHIHRLDPADRPFLESVAALALQHQVPIHIHSDAEPVEFFYSLAPQLTIIWAHAGMTEPPETVMAMMKRYPTLYADTSYREMDILAEFERWRPLLETYSDRLMVGTDTWINGQWDNYEGLIQLNRDWLSKLNRTVAEKIAFRNAERLFKRSVSQSTDADH